MDEKQKILDELREISPLLAENQPVIPYRVPETYFEGLADSVLGMISVQGLFNTVKSPTYEVPEGYFETLSSNILSRIREQVPVNEIAGELNEIAPLLNTVSKKEVYAVPAGYFDTVVFAANRQADKAPAKIVTLKTAHKWMQYAAAAVITGVLVTGAFLYTDNNDYKKTENTDRLNVTNELDKMSVDDLAGYLDNPSLFIAAPAATTLASEADLMDVKNNVHQYSDEELSQYVKENGEPYDLLVSEKENE